MEENGQVYWDSTEHIPKKDLERYQEEFKKQQEQLRIFTEVHDQEEEKLGDIDP